MRSLLKGQQINA